MTSTFRINLLLHLVFVLKINADFPSFYPCERIDFDRERFKCDLCRCVKNPIGNVSSELCASIDRLDCSKENQIEEFRSDSNSQLELNHFDDRTAEFLFQHSTWFFIESIFVNSFLREKIWSKNFNSKKLIFRNSTLNFGETNFSSVEILEISSIRTLDERLIIKNSTSLTHLTISETFEFDLSGNFGHLSFLNLRKTNLTDWRWNEILSMVQMPDLHTLILRENFLTSVTNKFPSTIRFLDLSSNQIRSLDYFSFKNLYSLNVLNLSTNSPLEIHSDTFTRIPYLEILDLSRTNLSEVDADLFLPLQKLRFLNLSSNNFDRLPSFPIPYDVHSIDNYDQFLPVLDVDLSSNKFRSFSNDFLAFSSTQDKYILTIRLKENQMKTLNFSTETKRRGPFIELDLRENPFECDCQLFNVVSNLFQNGESKIFLDRIKFLHSNDLFCSNWKKTSRFVDLRASESFCSFDDDDEKRRCPSKCFCERSADSSTIFVNCSSLNLTEIPADLPTTTTHLDLSENQIKQIDQRLKSLLNLKFLSLTKNQLENLVDHPFGSLTRLEHLDLSLNRLETISSTCFISLVDLTELFLHENFWFPRFYQKTNLFESNVRLKILTYGQNSICNRSTIGTPISAQICCSNDENPSCRSKNLTNETETKRPENFSTLRNVSTSISSKSFDEKLRSTFIYASSIVLIVFLTLIFVIFYQKRRSFFSKEKFLSHQNLNTKSNAYDKPLIGTSNSSQDFRPARRFDSHSNTMYDRAGQMTQHRSLSITDDDDYASIPLTNSQSDLALPIRQISLVPPLPPPRHLTLKRPVSQCLQIKLDVLVLYSINDCEFIHRNLINVLQRIYGRRFSFHFIHRDRMLGDLNWLINNSCLTLFILKKPHHVHRDFIKLVSSYPSMKVFVILISSDSSIRTISLKSREKLTRLYRTSNIFEWNSDPNSLIHEQLDLFLELNCGSSSFVTD